jgi:hypothetical protein
MISCDQAELTSCVQFMAEQQGLYLSQMRKHKDHIGMYVY